MNELRWILIAASIILLAWIYWQGRRKGLAAADSSAKFNRADPEPPQLHESVVMRRREPIAPIPVTHEQISVDDLPDVHVDRDPGGLTLDAALSTSALEKLTITQSLVPPEVKREEERPIPVVTSPPVKPVLQKPRMARKVVALRMAAGGGTLIDGARLREWLDAHGLRFGKYDIFHRYDERGDTLFSVASMVEPGTFDRATIDETRYPGVSLFVQLPSVVDGVVAFDEMLVCAQELQRDFFGNLFGERNAPLTPELAERMRESVADFQHLMATPQR